MGKSAGTLLVVGLDEARTRAIARSLESGGYRVAANGVGQAPPSGGVDLAVYVVRATDRMADILGLAPVEADILWLVEGVPPPAAWRGKAGDAVMWMVAPSTEGDLLGAVGDAVRRARVRKTVVADAERASRLLDGAPIGVFEVDGERLTYANAYLAAAAKYSTQELLSMRLRDLVAPEDSRRLAQALAERVSGAAAEKPSVYRFIAKDGEEREVEIVSRRVEGGRGDRVEGTARDVTAEARLARLHRIVLELGETILGEQDVERILQLVLDTMTEYSGFRRAVLTLYDLSAPDPIDGAVTNILCSGLSDEERSVLLSQPAMTPEKRRLAFSEEFRLGPAYYVQHDRAPWASSIGISGTIEMDGWHPDDLLFIPLRATAGIVGSISVDDPIDQSAPTLAAIEPIAHLASFAALAIERVVKLRQLRTQNERLHSLSRFGNQAARLMTEDELCDAAARRVCDDMAYDYVSIWLRDGDRMSLAGSAAGKPFRRGEIPLRGTGGPIEGESLTRWVVRNMEPAVVDDVSKDARYRGSRSSIRSVAVIPILGRKGVRGVLDVESEQLAAFGAENLAALTAMVSQLSTALAALGRRESLSRIYAFGQRISESTDEGQIVASALDFLAEEFSYPLASIVRQRRDGRLFIVGLRGPYAPEGVATEGAVLPPDQGIVSWVARNRCHALVNDVAADPRYLEALPGLRSELAVPMLNAEHLVGVLNVESPIAGFFDDEDRVLLEVIANHLATAFANLDAQELLREQTIRDPLTGLFNRHYFNSIIAPELSRSDRYARPLTMMMIDVDDFRAVNNRYGHLTGDEVLQEVARLLLDHVRAADRVIRYGGDEFLIFMPETGDDEAALVAARLREQVTHVLRKRGVTDIAMGFSIGIYTRRPRDKSSLEAILEEADRRLYADKRARQVDRADDHRG